MKRRNRREKTVLLTILLAALLAAVYACGLLILDSAVAARRTRSARTRWGATCFCARSRGCPSA